MGISRSHNWVGRFLIGLVLFINVESAIVFFFKPAEFTPSYELTGIPGQAAIQGMAILFLMWNVPYTMALINPIKYRVSLYEAIAMQSIGVVGEALILWALPSEFSVLRGSIWRFIFFDGMGWVMLMVAAWVTRKKQ